ncbi:hypothetical protein COO60DRAFT_515869 [Scenedesmus sp. NREL 46B-D3]|nr:hypothetical protein COO60DRAFT_515869 [Scenedesmus sp. NREL 46B-D3]
MLLLVFHDDQKQQHCYILGLHTSSTAPLQPVLLYACRNLLHAWVAKATRSGVPRHQVVHWVRRKAGASITVWRHLADGSLGVSVPCVVCKETLAQFDLRVTCMVAPGQWYCGRLTDPGAPPAKATSGQLMRMCKGSS